MMNNPTEPDYLYGPFIAILIYDLPPYFKRLWDNSSNTIDSTPIINRSVHEMS